MDEAGKFVENNRYFAGMSLLYGVLFTAFCYKNLNGMAFLLHAVMTVGIAFLFLTDWGCPAGENFSPMAWEFSFLEFPQ